MEGNVLRTLRRYEIIGFSPEGWSVPFEQIAAEYAGQFIGVRNYTTGTTYFQREQDIYYALEVIALRHLELPNAPDPGTWIEHGFDCALHYFSDDWKTDQDSSGYNMLMARSRRDAHVSWYTAAVRRGMHLPELPDELSAYLMTRRSIGIDK